MKYISILLLSIIASLVCAQQTADINNTVQLTADYSKTDQTITLRWEQFPDVTNFFVYEKEITSTNWGSAIATLPGTDTLYAITDVAIGSLKEYKVLRFAANGGAEAYANCGIEYRPLQNHQGQRLILVVERSIQDALEMEIDRYKEDVTSEGWEVVHIIVDKEITVATVKSLIAGKYSTSIAHHAVFILGHVAVPYSGNINPDGHNNHVGAWPCDGFYGDVDGTWTDNSVNNVTASQNRNHNAPGDGKYDQSTFPSDLEIAVGRVDMSNLDLFSEDEITLTRKYLDKNHQFRKTEIKSIARGVIENNFSLAEGFGQNGFRNFTTLLGRDNTHFGDYDDLETDTYLWSYGAGGGNYQGASGISNTTSLAQDSIQTIFTMLFGSYFGDWDSSNNFLRGALASGTTLTNAWAGRPHWHFHSMGMGSTISQSYLTTINNIGTYKTGFGARQIHIALMGDPSLKMEYVKEPSDLELVEEDGHVVINWKASSDQDFDGYSLYRSLKGGPLSPLNDELIVGTTFTDSCVYNNNYCYYVSATRLVEGYTGSYFNDSPYIKDTIDVISIPEVVASFDVDVENLTVTVTNTSPDGLNIFWDFGDGNFGNSPTETHVYDAPGEYTIILTVANACHTANIEYVVTVDVSDVDNILSAEVKIFPNPVFDELQIETNESISGVTIYNHLGQAMHSKQSDSKSINVAHLSAGIYVIEVAFQNKKKVHHTFVKE